MARYLRIAAAGFFALLALAFVALWVRSYHFYEGVSSPVGSSYFGALDGCAGVFAVELSRHDVLPRYAREWNYRRIPRDSIMDTLNKRVGQSVLGTGILVEGKPSGGFVVMLPYWLAVALSLALAALFAFKKSWRFTIRGLLSATTVVAGVLGLIAYSL